MLRSLVRLSLSLAIAGCAADDTPHATETCITATLADELGTDDVAACPGAALTGKADGAAIETPGMRFLRERSEHELATLFAGGHASSIPTGSNNGAPLLLGFDWVTPALSQIYVGSIWEPVVGPSGEPRRQPNGDPVVRLRDKWLRTDEGHLVTLFEARVTRGPLAAVEVAPGIAPPAAPSRPHPLVPIYGERLVLDGKPSLFVNYHDDPAPVINRILDEIREVDPVRCPGLYLGRAHYLRPGGEWVYLYWFALDFGPADRTCQVALP